MLFLSSGATAASEGVYQQALEDLSRQQIEGAYEKLSSVEESSADFVNALVESQKVHYRRAQWQSFFAYATFYRKKLLATPELTKKNFSSRMIALEVMALAKHCLWNEAREIGERALAQGREVGATNLAEIDETMARFKLVREFPKAIEGKADLKRPAPIFSRELLWPVADKSLLRVSHPRNLRMMVESRCRSS